MKTHHRLATIVFGCMSLLVIRLAAEKLNEPRSLRWYLTLAIASCLEYMFTGLVYRLTFHPLAKYPGPLFAACTDWYTVFWIAKGDRHLELYRQHKKHGKYVRYGPNRVSLNSATASLELHDVNSNTFKADVYGVFKRFFGAEMSLTTTDNAAHAFRRRVNVAALKPTVINSLGDRMPSHVDYLIKTLQQGANGKTGNWSSGKNMTEFLSYCIMDIMSDLTFTQTLNVQREDKNRHFVTSIPKGVGGMHLVGHMQCMLLFDMHKVLFRELTIGVKQFMDLSFSFADKRYRQYQEDGIKGNDIWEKLLVSQDPASGRTFTREELASEASLMITGGTDGMITTLTSTLFYLLHNPRTLSRLTAEVRQRFPVTGEGDSTECPISFASPDLKNFTYLLACLDEAMRLSPAVPSILPRRAGPGGITIDGQYFPAGTCLGIPHYCLHRNEEVFEDPFSYKPERWMGEGKTDAGHGPLKAGVGQSYSFTPFGAGRSSCVGKVMAYQEMSYILARLLWELDLRADPDNSLGEGSGASSEGRGRKDEFQTYCCFVSWQDGPVVQFRRRQDLAPRSNW